MKFAREFKQALIDEGYPEHWVESAIPYSQLKKHIKKVVLELRNLGLDTQIIAKIVSASENGITSNIVDGDHALVSLHYGFDVEHEFHLPKLTLLLWLENDQAIDTTLSSNTRKYLESLVSEHKHTSGDPTMSAQLEGENFFTQARGTNLGGIPLKDNSLVIPDHKTAAKKIEVPLTFDSEFFSLLEGDVSGLVALQAEEQKTLSKEIVALSKDILTITQPIKLSKSDLYQWRELFSIYIEAGVFFSTREQDIGSHNSTKALQQLQWFRDEAAKRGITKAFKLPASWQALDGFLKINITLLRNLKFQEINQLAISKILKKFDKRTMLGATKTDHVSKLIQSKSMMSQIMAKAICAQLQGDIFTTIPQLDDYLCPVCLSVVWRPIRMKCKHIFCIRCTILMQRERRSFCPLCRGRVVMEADQDNIDGELVVFLKKWFPKEVKEKQIEMETAAGKEQFGVYYKHPSESKCSLM